VDEIGAARLLEYNPGATLSVPQVIEYYNNLFKAMFDQMKLIPGSREFIQKAHRKGFKLGLTTSALRENQQRVFEMFNLWPFFSTVITAEDIINGKPHPEPYLKTAEKLGVAPANALVIEDSVNGVRSGKAAGCLDDAYRVTAAVRKMREARGELPVGAKLASPIPRSGHMHRCGDMFITAPHTTSPRSAIRFRSWGSLSRE